MIRRWCFYLLAVLGALVLLAVFRQWLAWTVLLTVLAVPWLSLAVSLPGMLSCRFVSCCRDPVTLGEEVRLELALQTRLLPPAFSYKLIVTRLPTGQVWRIRPGDRLPTEHCGQLLCVVQKYYVHDALGLFRHRKQGCSAFSVTVMPLPVRMALPAHSRQQMALHWRPKPGFAQDQELRLYRPGDGLNRIHWKLSAKVGKLTVREAVEPVQQMLHLAVTLREDGGKNDLQLGRLLYLGSELIEKGCPFCVIARTGSGIKRFPVRQQQELQQAVKSLLCSTPAENKPISSTLGWECFDLGGDACEI